MRIKIGLSLLSALLTAGILTACSTANTTTNSITEAPVDEQNKTENPPKKDQIIHQNTRSFTQFKTNVIPQEGELYRDSYDLSFSLNFWSQAKENVYGTGWLIDWKGNENEPNVNESFSVFLATNLHVADLLHNRWDYTPYNKWNDGVNFTAANATKFFSIAKYLDPKTIENLTQSDKTKSETTITDIGNGALVSIQSSLLPKTVYTAIDFINSSKEVKTDIFADFAVLELQLNLNNNRDKQIFDYFVYPAIQTYKALGDSLELFEVAELDSFLDQTYYFAGYPYLYKRVYNLLLNQPENFYKQEKVNEQKPIFTQEKFNTFSQSPTLTQNSRVDKKTIGSILSNTEKISDFSTKDWTYSYHKKEYSNWGYGLFLEDTNFAGGSSGSAVFNDNRKITSIFFGVLEAWDVGVTQILRAKTNNPLYSYDLIFGDQNTANYYAKFAKQHKTHMYSKILESQDEQYTFVNKNTLKVTV